MKICLSVEVDFFILNPRIFFGYIFFSLFHLAEGERLVHNATFQTGYTKIIIKYPVEKLKCLKFTPLSCTITSNVSHILNGLNGIIVINGKLKFVVVLCTDTPVFTAKERVELPKQGVEFP